MECEKKKKREKLPDLHLTVDRKRGLPGDIDLLMLIKARRQMLIMMIDRGFDWNNFSEVDQQCLSGTGQEVEEIYFEIFQNPRLERFLETEKYKPFGMPRISSNLVMFLLREMTSKEEVNLETVLQEWQDSFVVAGVKILTLITNDARERVTLLKKMKKIPGIYLQTYNITELLLTETIYQLTKHYLIPTSFRMTSEQVGELETALVEKKWSLDHLPALSCHDPYSKFHGLVPGDIVQMLRENINGDSILNTIGFYRRIIDVPIADEFKQ